MTTQADLGEDRLSGQGPAGALRQMGIASSVADPDTGTLYVVRLAFEGVNKVWPLFGLRLWMAVKNFRRRSMLPFSGTASSFATGADHPDRTGIWRNAAGAKAVISGRPAAKTSTARTDGSSRTTLRGARRRKRHTCRVVQHAEGGRRGNLDGVSGLAIDESDPNRDIYFSTGTSPYNPSFGADDPASVVRLRFDPTNTSTAADGSRRSPMRHTTAITGIRIWERGRYCSHAPSVLAGGRNSISTTSTYEYGKLSYANLLQPAALSRQSRRSTTWRTRIRRRRPTARRVEAAATGRLFLTRLTAAARDTSTEVPSTSRMARNDSWPSWARTQRFACIAYGGPA
jgi:hypothetical protein